MEYELPSGFLHSHPEPGESLLFTYLREDGVLPCLEYGQCDCDPWPHRLCKPVHVFPIDQLLPRAFAMIELGLVQWERKTEA